MTSYKNLEYHVLSSNTDIDARRKGSSLEVQILSDKRQASKIPYWPKRSTCTCLLTDFILGVD